MTRKLKFEQRFLIAALVWGLPPVLAALLLFWFVEAPSWLRYLAAVGVVGFWLLGPLVLRKRVVRPLQTVSNLLAALRSEDFSTRASGARAGDALGEVFLEINTLSTLLQEQRLGAIEATSLLRMVMEEIDVAVFAFDHDQKLRLINRAGERLLAQPSVRVLERTASELQLGHCLEGEASRVMDARFAGAAGRWSVRRSTFWQSGQQRQLVVVADVSRALREEERQAWQRLVRVLGHEINNSLAPIKSISGSLSQLIGRNPPPPDWREDMTNGLGVISSRAEALGRFMSAYTQLARLPSPHPRPLDLGPWLRRVTTLETRVPVALREGPAVTLKADPDQLEQALINLLKNAADSVLQHNAEEKPAAEPRVSVMWQKSGRQVEICVEDAGTGLANTANLFVPFFTTKPGGSGIGLVLSRQIAEAHGGALSLESRKGATGCVAILRLPAD